MQQSVPQHSALKHPGLYFRTVRRLRLSQWYYLVRRRLLPPPGLQMVPAEPRRAEFVYTPWLPVPQPEGLNHEFRFINETVAFNPESVDWMAEDQKKLWRYNLHYFDFLHWECFDDALKAKLIDSWIDGCPFKTEIAWDPYTLSLRITNWMKYFSRPGAGELPQRWLDSLFNQARWLTQDMEYQILANHLVKNAKALVFAGVFFEGPQAQEFLKLGSKVMLEQLREQFMADGGHFERSHMYHLIVTEDYLDLANLAAGNMLPYSEGELEEVERLTRAAVDYHTDLCAGDGEIQLFNDSTFGITADSAQFLDYAKRVLNYVSPDRTAEPFRVYKPETGYFGYRNGGDSFLIDCGAVGPDYQPGHAHCDTLSFDLCIDGQRVIVDSGNFTYEHLPIRYQQRQTAGHNTVRVDGEEQSEVWHVWRVGRRAYPLAARLSEWQDGSLVFTGAHDGYRRLPGKVVHEREVVLKQQGRWAVTDRLQGSGRHRLESFLHLHPDIAVKQTGDRVWELSNGEKAVARLEVTDDSDVSITDSVWSPEFGLKFNNKVVVMCKTAELPAELGFVLTKV